MTSSAYPAPKLRYSRPTLVAYGTMTSLTKSGGGSRPENKESNSRNKQRV